MPFSNFLNTISCGLIKPQPPKPLTTTGHLPNFDDKRITSSSTSTSQGSLVSESKSPKLETKEVLSPITLIPTHTSIQTPIPSPRTNKALVVAAKRTYAIVDHPFPELQHEKEVVISNRATGLNPIDYKSVDYNFCMPAFPWVNGREMAGVVEVVGKEVEGLRVGDRVWTSTYYRDSRAGTFQQYVTVPAHTVLPIPPTLSFEQASCLGVAGLTAAMSLWKWLEVPIPSPSTTKSTSEAKPTLLIWGGSTITGQFATQLALLSHHNVIAVASSKTAALTQALGASVVIRDGKSNEEIVAEIRALSGNITKAIDLVGPTTAKACLDCFAEGERCILAPLAMMDAKTVVPAHVEVVTVEMKRFVLEEAGREYAVRLNELVEGGAVRLPGMCVLDGGVEGIVEGLERVKRGEMGGVKLVVRMGC